MMVIAAIIFLLVLGIALFGLLGNAFTNIKNGGTIEYNEEAFQDYANDHYYREFSASSSRESNIMLFFLTNEEYDGYYALAWVGDNIYTPINEMFGDETTEFGVTVLTTIDTDLYKYSLDSSLASVAEKMADKIDARGYDDPFKDNTTSVTGVEPHLTNLTDIDLTEQTVNTGLEYFTEKTGIPIVIVVDEAVDAFGLTPPVKDIILVVVFFALIVIGIYLIVRAIKTKRNAKNNPEGDDSDPYGNFNNQSGYGGFR